MTTQKDVKISHLKHSEETVSRIKSEDNGIKITELTIPVESLPPSLTGYQVAVLTDFHYGIYTNPRIIKKSVALVKERNPELILYLGDYVHSGRQEFKLAIAKILGIKGSKYRAYRRKALEYAKELALILEELKPKDGIFSVWGNHDYIEGRWILQTCLPKHITHLNNELQEIVIDPNDSRAKIVVCGIDDYRYGVPNLEVLDKINKESAVKILLSHNPDFVLMPDANRVHDFEMILSGHTHGGQVCLPGGSPIKTETRQRNFYAGFYTYQNSPFYISNGIGCSGVPLRLNCPPEVVFLKFRNV